MWRKRGAHTISSKRSAVPVGKSKLFAGHWGSTEAAARGTAGGGARNHLVARGGTPACGCAAGGTGG